MANITDKQLLNSVRICNQAVDLYRTVLNSYVSDFYIENHWNLKVSRSWRAFLEKLDFVELGDLLNYEKTLVTDTAPLTFLCLREILRTFSINRKQVQIPEPVRRNEQFMKLFWKKVKLKKQHEVEIMSKICYQVAAKKNCFNIVDVGSGLGHLSRLLTFQYGFNICAFEANSELVRLATELDSKFEKMLSLKKIGHMKKRRPIHVNKRIEETLSVEDFEFLVRKMFNNFDDNFKYGLVGLHPCGNLGSTLIHLYNKSPNAIFLNMASCCYMKLSLSPTLPYGFPQSNFCKKHNYQMDYLLCEMACHAIENYRDKIKISHCHLKIHSFRAALENLLLKTNTNFRHCAVSNVKYEKGMSFKEYCMRATRKHGVQFSNTDLDYYEKLVEETWTTVVKFYSVRLLFAPLIESIILYDRLFYLQEHKSNCDILPLFNCQISPRNQVLCAYKSIY